MRAVDRIVLGYTWPALAAAAIAEAAAWLPFGAAMALFDGAFVAAAGLGVAYRVPVRHGEFVALQQAGVSPRRAVAAPLALAVAIAACSAIIACLPEHPIARTQYAGYALAALQLPLMASLTLPVVLRSPRRDPWALLAVLLIAYVTLNVGLKLAGAAIGWAPGLENAFSDAVLAVADVTLYREITLPRRNP